MYKIIRLEIVVVSRYDYLFGSFKFLKYKGRKNERIRNCRFVMSFFRRNRRKGGGVVIDGFFS